MEIDQSDTSEIISNKVHTLYNDVSVFMKIILHFISRALYALFDFFLLFSAQDRLKKLCFEYIMQVYRRYQCWSNKSHQTMFLK